MRYTICLIAAVIIISCNKATNKPAVREKQLSSSVVSDTLLLSDCGETFDGFFRRFSKDSIYQKEDVKFPLLNTYLNSGGDYEEVSEYIQPEIYRFSPFHKNGEVVNLENGSFEVSVKNEKDSAFYQQKGIDNGIFTIAKFALINGCWYLVAVEDSST